MDGWIYTGVTYYSLAFSIGVFQNLSVTGGQWLRLFHVPRGRILVHKPVEMDLDDKSPIRYYHHLAVGAWLLPPLI